MTIPRHRHRVSRFRAFYSVTGLASLAGVTRQEMRHILKHLPLLKSRPFGGRSVYYMRDIRESYPDLWESIRLKRELDIEEAELAETASAFAKTGGW